MAGPTRRASRLAWAAARALGGVGAHITVASKAALRIPWGVSDVAAAAAERWEFTLGYGPCVRVHLDHRSIRATQATLQRSWPALAPALLARADARSVLAVPLGARMPVVMTIYYGGPFGCLNVPAPVVLQVAALVAQALTADIDLITSRDSVGWPFPVGQRRLDVPVAVGMVIAALHVDAAYALSLLRARAFACDRDVDDVAQILVDRELSPHDLLND